MENNIQENLLSPTPFLDVSIDNIVLKNILFGMKLPFVKKDCQNILEFLRKYDGNKSTFENYKRELERLCHWSWLIAKKSILHLNRENIETFIKFCQHPPKSWIGMKRVPRFLEKNGQRSANSQWRPFVFTENTEYTLSQPALAIVFALLNSFYKHLLDEGILSLNPVLQIRQKSKFFRKYQGPQQVRRLSTLQWNIVVETAEELALKSPTQHERTLFIISALYLMYLRVSELVATPRWKPEMGHFYKDSQENWWFKTVSKGNKERHITVSDGMLRALKRYRQSLGLPSSLPPPGDTTALIHKISGNGPITSDRQIRIIVQKCFDLAVQKLLQKAFEDEAHSLKNATVHWLRHTGISDDINKYRRPIAHVRDDAGHSSSATTDRYNDITLQERHSSAKRKKIRFY